MSISTSLNRLGRNKKQNTYGYNNVAARIHPGQVTVYRLNKNDGYLISYLSSSMYVFRAIDTNGHAVSYLVNNTVTEYVTNSTLRSHFSGFISDCTALKSITESTYDAFAIINVDTYHAITNCPQLHTLHTINTDASIASAGPIFIDCPNLRNVTFGDLAAISYDLSGAPLSYESLLSFIHVLSTTNMGSYTITFYDGELTSDQITDITQKIEAKGYVSSPTSTLLTS